MPAKPSSPEVPNHALHEYVTSGIFTMVLHKTQIAMLEHMYVYQNRVFSEAVEAGHSSPMIRRTFVTASRSLEDRGLIVMRRSRDRQWNPSKELYSESKWLTKAGFLMIELLKEAGLIAPDLKPLPKVRTRKRAGARVRARALTKK